MKYESMKAICSRQSDFSHEEKTNQENLKIKIVKDWLEIEIRTTAVTVTFIRNNGSLTKDKYPGSKSQLFVLEKVTATFKCSGLGLNATSPYVLCSMLLFVIIVAQKAVFRFHKLFVPPQSGGMGASVKDGFRAFDGRRESPMPGKL